MSRQRGLTLLELLVVLAIMGLAMAGVSLSLRDNSQTLLEREAQRLAAILEAARAQSRTSGVALIWQTTPEGFVIRPALDAGTPQSNTAVSASRTETWLNAGTQAVVSTASTLNSTNTAAGSTATTAPLNTVVLGPEPILASARITLSVTQPNAAANTTALTPAATLTASPRAASLTLGTDGLRPFQVVP